MFINFLILENKIETLEKSLSESKNDLTLTSNLLAQAIEQLKIAEDRWLELSELSSE